METKPKGAVSSRIGGQAGLHLTTSLQPAACSHLQTGKGPTGLAVDRVWSLESAVCGWRVWSFQEGKMQPRFSAWTAWSAALQYLCVQDPGVGTLEGGWVRLLSRTH